jgi:hypothetical protein
MMPLCEIHLFFSIYPPNRHDIQYRLSIVTKFITIASPLLMSINNVEKRGAINLHGVKEKVLRKNTNNAKGAATLLVGVDKFEN